MVAESVGVCIRLCRKIGFRIRFSRSLNCSVRKMMPGGERAALNVWSDSTVAPLNPNEFGEAGPGNAMARRDELPPYRGEEPRFSLPSVAAQEADPPEQADVNAASWNPIGRSRLQAVLLDKLCGVALTPGSRALRLPKRRSVCGSRVTLGSSYRLRSPSPRSGSLRDSCGCTCPTR